MALVQVTLINGKTINLNTDHITSRVFDDHPEHQYYIYVMDNRDIYMSKEKYEATGGGGGGGTEYQAGNGIEIDGGKLGIKIAEDSGLEFDENGALKTTEKSSDVAYIHIVDTHEPDGEGNVVHTFQLFKDNNPLTVDELVEIAGNPELDIKLVQTNGDRIDELDQLVSLHLGSSCEVATLTILDTTFNDKDEAIDTLLVYHLDDNCTVQWREGGEEIVNLKGSFVQYELGKQQSSGVQKYNLMDHRDDSHIFAQGPFEVYMAHEQGESDPFGTFEYLSSHHAYVNDSDSENIWRYDCLCHAGDGHTPLGFRSHQIFSILRKIDGVQGNDEWEVYGYLDYYESGLLSSNLLDPRNYGKDTAEEEEAAQLEDFRTHKEIIKNIFHILPEYSTELPLYNVYVIGDTGIPGSNCDYLYSKGEFRLYFEGPMDTAKNDDSISEEDSKITLNCTGTKYMTDEQGILEQVNMRVTNFRVDQMYAANVRNEDCPLYQNYTYLVAGLLPLENADDKSAVRHHFYFFVTKESDGTLHYWQPDGHSMEASIEVSALAPKAISLFEVEEGIPEAPKDGDSYVRTNGQWRSLEVILTKPDEKFTKSITTIANKAVEDSIKDTSSEIHKSITTIIETDETVRKSLAVVVVEELKDEESDTYSAVQQVTVDTVNYMFNDVWEDYE